MSEDKQRTPNPEENPQPLAPQQPDDSPVQPADEVAKPTEESTVMDASLDLQNQVEDQNNNEDGEESDPCGIIENQNNDEGDRESDSGGVTENQNNDEDNGGDDPTGENRFDLFREISIQETKEKIFAGEPLENCRLPFINIKHATIHHDVVFKNCRIEGLLARGVVFKKDVIFHNCHFVERVDMSAAKEQGAIEQTVFEGRIDIRNCKFGKTLLIRNGEINGDFRFYDSSTEEFIRFDKSTFAGDIKFQGPAELPLISAYRMSCAGSVLLKEMTLVGGKENSLDFKQAQVRGILEIKQCKLKKAFVASRAQFGGDREALIVKECSLQDVDLRETQFDGKVIIEATRCSGKFLAEIQKEQESGRKKGRRISFNNDLIIDDCVFAGKCSFHGASFKGYSFIRRSVFKKEGVFNQAVFEKRASFWETQADKPLHFRKTQFGEVANFANVQFAGKSSFNEATFDGEAQFFNAVFRGDVFFSGAVFRDNLKMRQIQAHGGLGMGKISVDGVFNLAQSALKDRLILSESQFNGAFYAPALSVGTWGSLAKSIFRGSVDLGGLRVGAEIPDKKPTAEELALLDDYKEVEEAVIPGSFYCDEATFRSELRMTNSWVRGRLQLKSINTYAETDFTGLSIGQNLVLSRSYFRSINQFSGVTVKGSLLAYKARFKEETSFNHLSCRNAYLRRSSFDGGFTMRAAKISKELIFKGSDVDGKADLFEVEFGTISFQDFLVDRFLIARKAIGDILPSEGRGHYGQARNEYGILQQSFQMRSHYRDMDWAYYRFCRSNRKRRYVTTKNPFKKALLFFEWLFLDVGFGYGTRPMNIAFVALSTIAVFAGLFYCFPQGLVTQNGVVLEQLGIFDAAYLSTVTFASMDYGENIPRSAHWLKHMFALEGLLGIFLTTLFVATISRKIIRM